MTYTKDNTDAWMIQTTSNSNEFSLEVNEDSDLIGDHTLSIQVTLFNDCLGDITAKTIDVSIYVCDDSQLVETWSTPSVWEPTEYNSHNEYNLPTYNVCSEP